MPTNKGITELTFAERAPGTDQQVRQVCRALHAALVARIGHDQTIDRALTCDPDAAFELSLREDLDANEKQGWLWVAASANHPEAMAQMSVLTQIRAIEDSDSPRLQAASEQWRKHAMAHEGDAFPRPPIDQEEIQLLLEFGIDVTPQPPADASEGGIVVLPEIGDPRSRDGIELSKRYGHRVGRALPWSSTLPSPGEVRASIVKRWPWAEAIASEIEAQFAVLRRAGGLRTRLAPILLVGDPGCGKSTLGAWLGEMAGLSTVVLPGGASNDAGGLTAVTRGWVTSRPSIVASAMLESGTCNPLVVLDEIDKTTQVGHQNGSVQGALLSMVRSESYYDSCLQATIGIGGVSFIATANGLGSIDPALIERFTVIRMPSPRERDFEVLLQNSRQDFAKQNGLHPCEVPMLDQPESNLLRSYFLRNRSARAFSQAYGRLVSAKVADEEQCVLH